MPMQRISLPISKSIANRLLVLYALRGYDLRQWLPDATMPDDVRLLHTVLVQLQTIQRQRVVNRVTFQLHNCGTAMRFLTAYCAMQDGMQVCLAGNKRMGSRPIGQLVEALRQTGADIRYMEQEGFPPLSIQGKTLRPISLTLNQPDSTQFVSALLLIGMEVTTDCHSPYITMTQSLCRQTEQGTLLPLKAVECDWSAAAFWYEWVALHGGSLKLEGLHADSLQGDRIVASLFEPLGVKTSFVTDGIIIARNMDDGFTLPKDLRWDFADCPDLYPAVFATCHRLGITMHFTGLERLPLKESNRLQAMQQLKEPAVRSIYHSDADHRIAMALMAANYPVDDTQCVSKSYPLFTEQLALLTA